MVSAQGGLELRADAWWLVADALLAHAPRLPGEHGWRVRLPGAWCPPRRTLDRGPLFLHSPSRVCPPAPRAAPAGKDAPRGQLLTRESVGWAAQLLEASAQW